MRAGRMDRRIAIQQPAVTQSDSGQEIVAWTTLRTVWAEKIENRGQERFAAQQLVGHAIKTFKIRWASAIASALTNEYRITFDGRIFDITDIRELGRHEGIEIDCFASGEEPMIPSQVEVPGDPSSLDFSDPDNSQMIPVI